MTTDLQLLDIAIWLIALAEVIWLAGLILIALALRKARLTFRGIEVNVTDPSGATRSLTDGGRPDSEAPSDPADRRPTYREDSNRVPVA